MAMRLSLPMNRRSILGAFLFLLVLPVTAWCSFPRNVQDTLTIQVSLDATTIVGDVEITPFVLCPAGCFYQGPTQTTSGSAVASFTINSPWQGEYKIGANVTNNSGNIAVVMIDMNPAHTYFTSAVKGTYYFSPDCVVSTTPYSGEQTQVYVGLIYGFVSE
jgi:hypothetical protein